MKKLPPLLVYSVLRLLAFVVPLAVMWLFFPILREYWWLTAIFAAFIGASISTLFLRKPLSDASGAIHERRTARAEGRVFGTEAEDAAAEDAVVDATPEAPAAPDAEK